MARITENQTALRYLKGFSCFSFFLGSTLLRNDPITSITFCIKRYKALTTYNIWNSKPILTYLHSRMKVKKNNENGNKSLILLTPTFVITNYV